MPYHAQSAAPPFGGRSGPGPGAGKADCGHVELIRSLFREHNRALIRFLTAKLHSESEAQDVAQEAYVRLLQLENPGAVSFVRAYLFRIAANLAVDRIRQRALQEKNAPQQNILFEQLLTRPDPERTAIGKQQLATVRAALEELPDNCRKACALHFFAERSVREIAEQMNLTERMIRYHIARGLAHCSEYLDATAVDEEI